MRLHVVLRYVGIVLLFNAAFLLIAAMLSAAGSDTAFFPLAYSAVVAGLFGIFPLVFVPAAQDITNEEGIVIVVGSWLLSCVVGMLPYLLWGGEFSLANAWFESVSGYTTTGSSILTNIEGLPRGLLFWRSATHWIGGVGIIVFVIAILPYIGIAEAVLYRSEISQQTREKLRFRTRRAVQILVTVYVGLTLAESLLLVVFGMTPFDAVNHAFATIATGGFSTKNASLAHYDSVGIESVVLVFMVVSGMHFGLLFVALTGRWRELWRSAAVRYYLAALAVGSLVTAVSVHGNAFSGWGASLRYATFQVASVGTSTGFANADSSIWPAFAQLVLVFFTLQCACVGSTSGGIKVDRVVLFAKAVGRMVKKLRYPSAVLPVRMDGSVVSEEIVEGSVVYLALYLVVVFVSALLLTALGVDALSAFSGAAAAMGNVGPGLGQVGSLENYAAIPAAGKWVLTGTMLLGRLEIYGLLVFFMPRLWSRMT